MNNCVLIIEDSKSFSSLLSRIIKDTHGFETVVAPDLATTKQILAMRHQDFFCAIVDLNLPDATHGEAVPEVAQAGIPVVVFTSSLNQAVEEDLWAKGIADYANKSGAYSLEYLVWKIKRLYDNANVQVMVVDDSKIACKSMGRMLRSQRLQVHLCQSGKEALATIEKNPDIRVVITDCNMDEMDGLELTSKLRESHTTDELEIIGVSASGGQDVSAKFIKCGASDFLRKPFSPEEFHCRVNRSIDRIEAYLKLRELNQIKNQFLGTAAHDIRGPIGAIKTAGDFLALKSPSPERSKVLVEMIRENSTDLLELLDSLLDISAIESGVINITCEPLNMADLLNERMALYQANADSKGIGMERLGQNHGSVYADKIKIKQVIDNLITNAIKCRSLDLI